MTLRIDTNGNAVEKGEVVQIGGNESYVAVCRYVHSLSLYLSFSLARCFYLNAYAGNTFRAKFHLDHLDSVLGK